MGRKRRTAGEFGLIGYQGRPTGARDLHHYADVAAVGLFHDWHFEQRGVDVLRQRESRGPLRRQSLLVVVSAE